MKKIVAIVVVMGFGALGLAACGDPCDKAFTKAKKCFGDKGSKRDNKKARQAWTKVCKKADQGELKKCLDQSCEKFIECYGKALRR
jgi:hypothetical protein